MLHYVTLHWGVPNHLSCWAFLGPIKWAHCYRIFQMALPKCEEISCSQTDFCRVSICFMWTPAGRTKNRGPTSSTSTHFTKSPLWTETCWPAPGRVTLNWLHFIEKVLRAGLQEMDRNGTKCLLQLTGGLVLLRGSAVQSEEKKKLNCRKL